MKYCIKCRGQIFSGKKFCTHCGKQQPAYGFEKMLDESPVIKAIAESPIAAKAFPWAAAALVTIIILLFITGFGIPISVGVLVVSLKFIQKSFKAFQGKS
jgi:uncharacterized membrane protein YvbJ